MKKILTLVLALFVLVGLSGCTTDNQITQIKTIKIGVIMPLSGPGASYGEDSLYAIQTSVEEFNSINNDYKIDLIVENGKCNANDAVSAVQKLINIDKVSAIIGGGCSSETIAAGKIAQSNKVLMISPQAGSSEISHLGDYIFRFTNNKKISDRLLEYTQNKFHNIVIIYENKDSPTDLKSNFEKNRTGGLKTYSFDSNEKDFELLIKQINFSGIDALITFPQSESTAIPLFKSIFKAGIPQNLNNKILGHPVLLLEKMLAEFSGKMEGFTQANSQDSQYIGNTALSYMQSLKGKYSVKSTEFVVFFSKEVISLLIDAIKQGNTDTESIKKYLETIKQDNLRNGYVGKYYFNEDGDATGIPYVIETIKNGEKIILE